MDSGTRAGRRIGIIGAGPGGICAGIKLKAAGYDDFVIIEKSAGVGGTWRNNRYPGLTCDVRSWSYSFTFEPNAHWSSHYAGQPEILAYMERVAEKYGLAPHLRLGRKVTAAQWDEATSTWRLTAGEGETHVVDILIAAQGMFNDLNWPDLPGLDSFKGVLFHSGDWRDDHDLTGRRVGVLGTAASAVQFVPKIAPKAASLTVFQRSPNWVAPKDDPPITPEERARLSSDPAALDALRREVHEGLEAVITFSDPQMRAAATQAAIGNLETVRDPTVREQMRPDIPWGCLRPLMSNEYYPTFNLPHVALVTEPVERITANGVVTRDGRLHEVDTLICATGYHVRRYLAAIDVTGRDGQSLASAWADGATAYLGIMTSGFPNLFMLYGPNTNNGSILYMLERQCDFVVRRLQEMDRDGLAWIDVRREVMDAYNADLQVDLENVEVWKASCSNYYRTESGRIVTQWPHNMAEYQRRCEASQEGRFESGRAQALAPAAGD